MTAAAAVLRRVRIVNSRGLHARAAARLVKLARDFDAEVTLATAAAEASALSIMDLLVLTASPGTEVEVRATGPQAVAAVAAVAALIEGGFEED